MRGIAHRPRVWVASVLLAAAPAVTPAIDGLVYRGTARDITTGRALYREIHHLAGAGTAREARIVLYQCASGKGYFARKEVQYVGSREMPRFTLVDALWSYSEGLRTLPNGRLQVFQVPGQDRAERNALLPAGKTIVADAGFDEFLRRHWTELERGQSLRFPFLVPSRLHWIDFRVSKNREEIIDGAPAVVVRLNLSGVLGWFLPYIEASYRKSDQALLRYKGITNLRDAAGHNFQAIIDFPQTERRAEAIDVAALRAVPLVRRCD